MPGTVGDVWVTCGQGLLPLKFTSGSPRIQCRPGILPVISLGWLLPIATAAAIIGFAAPTCYTGTSIQVTITGTVFGTLTTWIGLDSFRIWRRIPRGTQWRRPVLHHHDRGWAWTLRPLSSPPYCKQQASKLFHPLTERIRGCLLWAGKVETRLIASLRRGMPWHVSLRF